MSIAKRITQFVAVGVGVVTSVVSLGGVVSAMFNPIEIAPAHASPPAADVSQQLYATFKSTCYDLMPETAAVARHAEANGWTAITGISLRMLAPPGGAKSLAAWKVPASDGRAAMTVTVSVADMDKSLAEAVPEFAGSDVYGCSVIPGANTDIDRLAQSMAELIGRAHDGVNDNGPLVSHDWVGQTNDLAVVVSHYRPKLGDGINMLSVMAVTK